MPQSIVELLDELKKERGDESRSHTARVLIREALAARGKIIKNEVERK